MRVGRNLKDHLVLTPPYHEQGPDCSQPHPAGFWIIPGLDIPHIFRQTVPVPHQ